MSMTDSISDMLTRIRNGQKAKLLNIAFPCSNFKLAILRVLKEEGYISNYDKKDDTAKPYINVQLKYHNSIGVIKEVHKVSKPGKRIYSSIQDLIGYYNNMGIYILSTSAGVLSDREARQKNVGGEVLCKLF